MADTWAVVEARRHWLADELGRLEVADWDVASWCGDWTVRDVVAHLVHLSEATQWSIAKDVARNRFIFDRALDHRAREIAAAPTDELIARLRAGATGRFHAVGTPPEVALGEMLVHPADIFEPLGRDDSVPADIVRPVLPVYRRFARFGYHARGIRKVRLVAEDADWSAGQGPEVRGRALDLLLLMANRKQVRARLTGPGVAILPD